MVGSEQKSIVGKVNNWKWKRQNEKHTLYNNYLLTNLIENEKSVF